MSKIKKDFLGLYVAAGGYISRPLTLEATQSLKEGDEIKTRHRSQTTDAILTKLDNTKMIWTTTGMDTMSYTAIKNHLPQDEFEKVVLIQSAYYLMDSSLYPKIKSLHPHNYVDFRDPQVQKDFEWSKSKINEAQQINQSKNEKRKNKP